MQKIIGVFALLSFINGATCLAWSNRGHRTINLVAAESLPSSMPAFIRTPAAIKEISYLGPEPDRWGAGGRAPALAPVNGPDHVFRVEMAEQLGVLPRSRYDFYRELQQHGMTPNEIGTLPWAAQEVFERLEAAFHTYRILHSEFPKASYADMEPLTQADLPDVEASAIFYAGWLGYYIGDGSMPLHDTVNVHGWIKKPNPHGYNTRGDIHHRLELVTDNAIGDGSITPAEIRALEKEPAKQLDDPFVDLLSYLKMGNSHEEEVYKYDQAGAIQDSGTPAFRQFIERQWRRAAECCAILSTRHGWTAQTNQRPNVNPPRIF